MCVATCFAFRDDATKSVQSLTICIPLVQYWYTSSNYTSLFIYLCLYVYIIYIYIYSLAGDCLQTVGHEEKKYTLNFRSFQLATWQLAAA